MLNYVKHVESGEISTLDKNKDPRRPIKGTAFIQIANDSDFDDVVIEAQTENILITETIEDTLYYAMVNPTGQNVDTFSYSPFGQIVLTNYEGSEDANNTAILGDTIGFANAQIQHVSTTNPKQGNVDSIDSVYDYNNRKIEFTFNFVQGKANGKFQTLWWTFGRDVESDTLNSQDGLALTPVPIEAWDTSNMPTGTYASNPDGDLFIINATNIFKYRMIQVGTKKSFALVETKANTVALRPSCCTFNPVKQEIVAWFRDSALKVYLYRFDTQMNYISHTEVTNSKPNWRAVSTHYTNFLTFHGRWMYAFENKDNSIHLYNYDLNYVKTFTAPIPFEFDTFKGAYSDQDYLYVFYQDVSLNYFCATYKTDDQTGEITLISKAKTGQKNPQNVNGGAYLWDKVRKGYIIHPLGYFLKSFHYATAQTRLVTPITKEDNQYMRLKYTFQFQ